MSRSRTRCVLIFTAGTLAALSWTNPAPDAQVPLLPGFQLSHYPPFEPVKDDVWPGDFNGDGRTDLVGSFFAPGGYMTAVALGNGNGTFREPAPSTATLTPWGVGDFNGDGRLDLVGIDYAQENGPPFLYVMAGNGDGSLGQQHLVDATTDQPFTFAIVADFNADGRRDIVAGQLPDRVFVYPGNGDFTFAPRQLLVSGSGPSDASQGDFNGDGRRDFVVANRGGETASVFLNSGGLLFRRSDVALDGPATDISARDLNGDGRLDLVVASTASDGTEPRAGRVFVLRGNGNGTFNPGVSYETGRGAAEIVVADFSRDGRADILTANRSGARVSCGFGAASFDTVSLLVGRSDGTFAAAIHFSLQETNEPFELSHVNTVTSLNTSDFNGDGHQDAIVSGGALLLNRAPAANRAPVPQVEFDTRQTPEGFVLGRAVDPDFHALTFTWTDTSGNVVANAGTGCVQLEAGDNFFTLTVDDGHGGRASATSNVVWFIDDALMITSPSSFSSEVLYADTPYRIEWFAYPNWFTSFDLYHRSAFDGALTPIAECQNLSPSARACVWQSPVPISSNNMRQIVIQAHRPPGKPTAEAVSTGFQVGGARPGTLPQNWDQATIGDTILGAASHENGTFTVKGAGADIWGTSDEFHFASLLVTGDFEFIARVASVQNVNPWTKAGLMIRNFNLPSETHASLFATPGRGVSFQRRRTEGGSSVLTAGPAVTAPVWLRLVRSGNVFTAFSRRTATEAWTRIGSDTIPIFETATVGLAVTSHVDGRLATATFDNVSITPARPWLAADVSASTDIFAGSHLDSGGTVTVRSRSLNIWDTADQFRFVYQPMIGDGSIVARVKSIENTHPWAKAGVMIRESTAAGSKNALAFVTPSEGLALQHRSATGGTTARGTVNAGGPPRWLRLVRQGNTFVGSVSADGTTWREIGRTTITMGANVFIGLAVTSRNTDAHAAGAFDNITIVP